MTLNQNQFSQSVIKGQLDLQSQVGTVSCQVGSAQATALIPGQAVKLVDSAGGVPKVIAVAADTDEIFGFVNYSQKQATFVALDAVEVSMGLNVMFMESNAAIARGAKLMVVVSGTKVATATVGKSVVGWAYDKAAGSGELIRVFINTPARPGDEDFVPAATVAALAGTLTGTVDGTIVDTAASACAGGSSPTAAQVDTAIASLATAINVQLKELQTTLNAEIAAIKAAGLQS